MYVRIQPLYLKDYKGQYSDNTLHPSHRPFLVTTVCSAFAAIPICLESRPTHLSSFYYSVFFLRTIFDFLEIEYTIGILTNTLFIAR